MEGLSRTASGRVVPPAAERWRRRTEQEDPFIGWTASISVFLLALFLRLWKLGTPHRFAFDETYYAKDAWSLLHFGYARGHVEKANERILDGTTTGLWTDEPSMVVHPEVGKWIIAAGERLFGMDPFGWRVSAAVIGSLMVLVMCRLVRRLTGSTLLGCVAGLLLCFDGLQLVLSRLALLDIFLTFFILCAVACLVADRDWTRARMADSAPLKPTHRGGGPRPWRRPRRGAGGGCFGLALGTKWSAVFPLAAFGLLVWAWDAGARRSFGIRGSWWKSLVVDALPAFVQLVVVAFVVYVASWTGWLVHADEYEAHLSDTQYTAKTLGHQWPTATEPDASGLGEVAQSLESLWYYHRDVLQFHTAELDDSTHTYQSHPLGWLLLNRPVGVDAQLDIQPGQQGCDAPPGSDCLRQVLLIGTPVLWWGACLSLVVSAVIWVGRRDWRHGLAVVGALATWLPWLPSADRPIFLFYAMPTLLFMVVSLELNIGHLVSAPAPSPRRTVGTIVAGSFFMLVLVNFAWFWPIWTDGLLTHSEWLQRIWFQRWI